MIKIFFLILSLNTFASYFHTFGPSINSIATQDIAQKDDFSAFIYLSPAKLSWTKTRASTISILKTTHSFTPITNVVIKNDTNSTSGEELGDVNLEIDDIKMFQVALALPLFDTDLTVGVNLLTTGLTVADSDTGDPVLPDYPLFRSRNNRSEVALALSKKITQDLAIGVGTTLGFGVDAEANTAMSIDSNEHGSLARAKTEITPKIAPYLSIAYRRKKFETSILWRKVNKSTVTIEALGVTTSPRIPYKLIIESMPYFSPEQLTISVDYKILNNVTIYTSITKENWEEYKTPQIIFKEITTIKGSDQLTEIKGKKIINFSLGVNWSFKDHFSTSIGYSIKENPLSADINGNSNSITAKKTYIGASFGYQFNSSIKFELGIGQITLEERNVIKTPLQEDGTAGNKIGSTGYKIGGDIYTIGASVTYHY